MDCLAPPSAPKPQTADRSLSLPGFDILREIGHGGHGIVYLAREQALDRLVALKVLRQGVYAHAAERQRFQTEARVLARLRHPNVVQIHGVGEHDRVGYYFMEWLDGGSLSRRLDGTPSKPRDAAELLVAVARGVQAIHEMGIVHRDLKPANILLSFSRHAEGVREPERMPSAWRRNDLVPKITDFGLAKGHDSADTPTEAILGTPSYMAPEQALGQSRQVGPAADVYSLGAILYELLTGRPPFKGETPFDTLTQVRDQEPVAPRTFQPKVPRDLETICLKCLRKDPTRRYGSAVELADDLQRFLDGRSILARPAGLVEKSWRWCGRNPVTAALVATLGLVVLGGFAALTGMWVRAESERLRAEESLAIAGNALDDLGQRIGSDILLQRDAPSLSPEAVQTSLDRYHQFEARALRVPQLRLALTSVYHRMFDAYLQSGQDSHAKEACLRELVLCDKLLDENPRSADYRLRTAWACDGLGRIPTVDRIEVIPHRRRAVDLYAGLVDEFPDDWTKKRLFAFACHNLALDLMAQTGQPREAIPHAKQAVEEMAETTALNPEAGLFGFQVHFLTYLARLHSFAEEMVEAQKAAEEAEAVARKAVALYPKDSGVAEAHAKSYLELARIQKLRRDRTGAMRLEERASDLYQGLIDRFISEDVSLQNWRAMLVLCHFNLGDSQRDANWNEEARDNYLQVRKLGEELSAAGYDGPIGNLDLRLVLAGSYFNLGLLGKRLGETRDTIGLYEKARPLLRQLQQNDPTGKEYVIDLGELLLFTANEAVDRALNVSGFQAIVPANERARYLHQAEEALKEALELGYRPPETLVESDDLAALRSWPTFRELLNKVKDGR